ncbi:hypothetical protein EDB92DRAFT_1858291 [Lactarius akahatsu]|uniref:Uncharacterized protein n=1 Tax=Lactarius akahatsu TaxID=416441 RepID=A0AAD4LMG2_9AGAM|nr:hypothetical protein EDB92DRAFT_1858291 [Lactarius akahatsu]
MQKQDRFQLTSGPSTKSRRKASPNTEPMAVDPLVASPVPMAFTRRVPPDNTFTFIAKYLPNHVQSAAQKWKHDGTDAALKSDEVLTCIHALVSAAFTVLHSSEGLVNVDQFKRNLTKKSASGFVNLLGEAINGDDEALWSPVVTHDVFHTEIHDDPDDLTSSKIGVHRKYQEEAVTKSWKVPFIGDRALQALEWHVIEEKNKAMAYGPYCSIVQSSGMGKSRLLDEFSKNHFLIPVNLRRKETSGFPPPDDAIRDLLTQVDENGMLHFLIVLFEKTTRVITNELKGATTRSTRITKFREFMTEGQTMAGVGEKRQTFYNEIAAEVKVRTTSAPNHQDMRKALEVLITDLGPQTNHSEAPDVFVAFDEAHSLTEPDTSRTHFVDLQSALHKLTNSSFFSFFVSTTSKISQFTIPRDMDPSNGTHEVEFMPPLSFSDLGFDHLMHDRKIFDRYKTIEDVTSTECIVHMGRPLQVVWGTLYDCGSEGNRKTILEFAVAKLLCRTGGRSDRFTSNHECAVLSQRLALDLDGTTSGFTRIHDKVQLQISNFMRVCVSIPRDSAAVRSVAASEPILSEAASLIMRGHLNFNLPDALINILGPYATSHGDGRELLVAAFFTRARDLYARQVHHELFPYKPTRFCPIFSVKDLLSNLFHPTHFITMLGSLPSVCRADFPSRKFGDVFGKTKIHFNHMIQPFKRNAIDRSYLVSIIARGAAVFDTNCQPGFDMVYPYLYDTSDLVINKVGFIVVQVNNYTDNLTPDANLFKKMDPFLCELVSEDDRPGFTIPIIRIPSFKRMRYNSPEQGAATFDVNGQPQFTSYDFWCSGIGPDLLQPVDEDKTQWVTLLDKTDRWDRVFSTSTAPDVRRSHYPGGGNNQGHYGAWMM